MAVSKEMRRPRTVALMSVGDTGHLNPLLALAEVLQRSGFIVYFFVPRTAQDRVEALGAIWCHYGSADWDLYTCAREVSLHHLGHAELCVELRVGCLPMAAVPAALGVLPYLIGRVAQLQPDFIVFDAACPWASLISQLLRIPAICSMTALPMPQGARDLNITTYSPEGQKVCRDSAAALKAAYGLEYNPSYGYSNYTPHTIVWSSRAWHKGHEEFDESQFRYWGPLMSERRGLPMPRLEDFGDKPLVFVSFGTVATDVLYNKFQHVLHDFYSKVCLVAASMPGVAFVISIGKKLPAVEASDGEIVSFSEDITVPSNMFVARSVDQLTVLRRSSIFVTHCGQNSSSEAVLTGVPVIACPLWGDQPDNAARFEELGCGLVQSYFPHAADAAADRPADEADLGSVTAPSLGSAIRRLLDERSFAEAVAEVRKRQEEETGRPIMDKIEEMLAHVAEESKRMGSPVFPLAH